MTLYAIPTSMRSYHDIQREFAGNLAGVLIEAGVFTDLTPGVTFFAHARDRSGGLSGIIVDDARDRSRHLIYTAERGAITVTPEGPRAMLENGTYQETNLQTGQVSMLYFDHTSVELGSLFNRNNGPRRRSAEELYLGELFSAGTAEDKDTRGAHACGGPSPPGRSALLPGAGPGRRRLPARHRPTAPGQQCKRS